MHSSCHGYATLLVSGHCQGPAVCSACGLLHVAVLLAQVNKGNKGPCRAIQT
jgi:hypothetical protein